MGLLSGAVQVFSLVLISLALAIPAGEYLAAVFTGKRTFLGFLIDPLERAALRLLLGPGGYNMGWREYAVALLATNVFLWLIALAGLWAAGMSPDLAFHTASSFVTNTDQQHYAGDTLAPPAQMLLTGLMFASAATGLASAFALIRGLTGTGGKVGNFFADFARGVLRVFLPLAIVFALVLGLCGVPQTTGGSLEANTIAGGIQKIPLGPVASLESIKFLGTNGGGYYGAGSAHPFENPSPLTNAIECILTLLLPFSLPWAFGIMLGNRRQAVAILAVMAVLFLAGASVVMTGEAYNSVLPPGQDGYMEGKEQRFSAYESAFFIAANTYVQSGGTSSSITSMMPLSVLGAMLGMILQCAPGGVGTGFDVMIVYVLLSVFIAGLMVGRTPEFLGKKIEPREMKLIALAIIVHPALVLLPTALAIVLGQTQAINPGARGFDMVLYEFLSASANNGSSMVGLQNSTPFYNLVSGLVILAGRYVPLLAVLAIAGLLSGKKPLAATGGTLRTDNLAFAAYLAGIILVVGAITFLPALTLGPIAEIFAGG